MRLFRRCTCTWSVSPADWYDDDLYLRTYRPGCPRHTLSDRPRRLPCWALLRRHLLGERHDASHYGYPATAADCVRCERRVIVTTTWPGPS